MKRLLLPLIETLALPSSINAEKHTFESWGKSHFKNYPFECVPTGSTPEYTSCASEDLLKSDWKLKKRI